MELRESLGRDRLGLFATLSCGKLEDTLVRSLFWLLNEQRPADIGSTVSAAIAALFSPRCKYHAVQAYSDATVAERDICPEFSLPFTGSTNRGRAVGHWTQTRRGLASCRKLRSACGY